MNRQKIRKGLLLAMFLSFPVTIYYFSPALIIMGASEGVITGSFVVFSAMFAVSLFLGRSFCGWACPGAGLQEACFTARNRPVNGGRWDLVKYLIWAPWVAVIVLAAIRAGGLQTLDFTYQTDGGISVRDNQSYIIFYFIVILIAGLALGIGRRAFCHYVCWMAPFMIIGNGIRNLARLPALRLLAESELCIECKKCTDNCPMSLDVMAMAKKGTMKNTECILCGTCVDICPRRVIRYSFSAWK